MIDSDRYGPWALIVGGSEGVGAGFARRLAVAGIKLVLVARKEGPLAELAAELQEAGAEVRTISVDLARPDALDRVRAVTDDVEIGLMIYNAGANSVRGNFVELPAEVTRAVIQISVVGQSEFARHYGAQMCARGHGGMILAGSLSSYMGAPSLAAYTASKAFSRIFGEALWAECAPLGVDVLHLVIGFTATPAMERLHIDTTTAQDPEDVAQEALANLTNGPVWIAGGEGNLETAIRRSVIADRGATIRQLATPSREAIVRK
ncbi:MAG: SDR family NAD(P)-dependent oxidoreductase [Novosphingobium sp.]|nr:SDR family NAD(P)-dependent oxidoreductase [Novosphingobium sp.]